MALVPYIEIGKKPRPSCAKKKRIALQNISNGVRTSQEDRSLYPVECKKTNVLWIGNREGVLRTQVVEFMFAQDKRCLRREYMDFQPDVTQKMRRILVEWLSEVVEDYNLDCATLHLCVGYVDRYLGRKPIRRDNLQLLGVSSLLIASKFEETVPCKVGELVDLCSGLYTAQQIFDMELDIIETLEFALHVPTIYSCVFWRVWSPEIEDIVLCVLKYVAELVLTNYFLLRFDYERVSSCIIRMVFGLFSMRELNVCEWDKMDEDVLAEIRSTVALSYVESVKGLFIKYSHKKYKSVSRLYTGRVDVCI